MIYDPRILKRCSKCHEILPGTTEYFHLGKSRRDGFNDRCKRCVRAYYEANKEREMARVKRWQKEHPDRTQQYKDAWRKNHPEYDMDWYWKHREKTIQSQIRYNRNHPEKVRKAYRKYRESHPDKIKTLKHRREARKRNLPNTFIDTERRAMLNYWHGLCAYCGNPSGLFDNMRICDDHYIPLDFGERCPGTVAGNMLPACKSCNSSKNNHDPIEWLTDRFGPRKAKRILKRIQEYFAWVREQDAVK